MFSESNFSAADLAAVVGNNRNSDDMWGGNGIWIILFLLLILGGRGFGFGNDGVSNGGYPTSVASSGEPVATSQMIVTPAAVENYFNVSSAIYVTVPAGCCLTISVKNTSTQSIEVQNANLIVTRVA